MNCDTVQIKGTVSEDNPTGMVIINASDFVEGQHELFGQEGQKAANAGTKPAAAKKSSTKVPEAAPAPVAEAVEVAPAEVTTPAPAGAPVAPWAQG